MGCGGYCGKCTGGQWITLGVIVLLNVWLGFLPWWTLVGVLLVLAGLLHVFKPSCGCEECCPPEMGKKAKK